MLSQPFVAPAKLLAEPGSEDDLEERLQLLTVFVISIGVLEPASRDRKIARKPIENHFQVCKLCVNLAASDAFLATIDNVLSVTYTF